MCHYPPGTSKWNRIEHRMFSFITMNWRGPPLTSLRNVVEVIFATTTETRLSMQAAHDANWYPKGGRSLTLNWPPSDSTRTTGSAGFGLTSLPGRARRV